MITPPFDKTKSPKKTCQFSAKTHQFSTKTGYISRVKIKNSSNKI